MGRRIEGAGAGGRGLGRGAIGGGGVHGWVVLGRAPIVEGGRLADRGPRVAAGDGHKKECPAPCSGPATAPLCLGLFRFPGPAPLPMSGRRGHGCEAAVPTGQTRLRLAGRGGGEVVLEAENEHD